MKTYYLIQDLAIILTGTALIFIFSILTTKKNEKSNWNYLDHYSIYPHVDLWLHDRDLYTKLIRHFGSLEGIDTPRRIN